MLVDLLNGQLKINIRFTPSDSTFDDNICLCIEEPCHEDEKVFRAEQTNLFLTPDEARSLAEALLAAAELSDYASKDAI